MLTEKRLSPLSLMFTRETGTVVEVRDPSPPGSTGGGELESLFGFLPGERVRVIGNGNGDKVVVLVRESHVCMAERVARRIVVMVDAKEQKRSVEAAAAG
jgi:Fe2+ transport system protein FeoA